MKISCPVVTTITVGVLALVATFVSIGTSSVFVQNHPLPATSHITRAEVKAELAQSKRYGSIAAVYSCTYNPLAAANSLRTRAEVRAELLATDCDERAAMQGEDNGSFALSRPGRGEGVAGLCGAEPRARLGALKWRQGRVAVLEGWEGPRRGPSDAVAVLHTLTDGLTP
jgi:hypothetical protein